MVHLPATRCTIVPPYLLEAMAAGAEPHAAASAERTLRADVEHRRRREGRPTTRGERTTAPAPTTAPGDANRPERVVSDAGGQEALPGIKVRGEGDPATGDAAADEAYDGLGDTWRLFREEFARNSLDGKGLPLLASVHFGRSYDNAFWDGTQMVFGDGDGTIFNRFTLSLDVIGHELTHGVTELTAGLTYQGQPGALNESISDVFGSLVKQRALGQTAAEADWLIGAGLFTDRVDGVALRSMKAPGTAYDDPQLGKDPQPATMADYVETSEDNGGVHINSGIPNRAFHLAATAIGGNAWEAAGQIWYATLTGEGIAADCDFATFASLTLATAETRYAVGSPAATAVRSAWVKVGVLPGEDASQSEASGSDSSAYGSSTAAEEVRLRRTGGFAGLRQERTVALDDLPPGDARDWRRLLAGDHLRALGARPGRAIPDAYTFHVACPPDGDEVELAEHDVPSTVRDLFQRTLGAD